MRDVQKKALLVWSKSFKVCDRSHVETKFFIFQSSLKEKLSKILRENHAYLLFHWFSDENCIILHFLYTIDNRLQQIKKKHEWWNNRFPDVFTYCLNLIHFAFLFFLMQEVKSKCFDHNIWNNEKRKQYKQKQFWYF